MLALQACNFKVRIGRALHQVDCVDTDLAMNSQTQKYYKSQLAYFS